MKKIFHFITSRLGTLILLVAFEILWIAVLGMWLHRYAWLLEIFLKIAAGVLVVIINGTSQHLSCDAMWIVIILLFPVAGTAVYIILDILERFQNGSFKSVICETKKASSYYVQDPAVREEIRRRAPELQGQISYIADAAGFPVCRNRGFDYYRLGEDAWPVMLKELKGAKRFIFIEYFIIEKGKMWDSILEILREKTAAGVECRVLYDDLGSINAVPIHYADELEKMGIRAQAFNKVNPIINGIMKHRDHCKILVVDGRTAFTGGINLSDQYVNLTHPHGVWKDNCARITGEAVRSMTIQFLTMWNAVRHEDEDYGKYLVSPAGKRGGEASPRPVSDGWIAPYFDTPFDRDLTGENIFLNILNQARQYCYIFAPYLILDNTIQNAIMLAAQRGVDVRLLTPGKPDKIIVWNTSRTYFSPLLKKGVRIYSYTPGFIHEKTIVCDDRVAVVGTQNLDYRSLYLHFENGVCLFRSEKIPEIRKDFEDTIALSHEVTLEEMKKYPVLTFFFWIVRIFAPLM
ncbi:MAG: phospholipase D-like domain-containing protein [Bilifractor sp.]|jgi:cardiolipin synthase